MRNQYPSAESPGEKPSHQPSLWIENPSPSNAASLRTKGACAWFEANGADLLHLAAERLRTTRVLSRSLLSDGAESEELWLEVSSEEGSSSGS